MARERGRADASAPSTRSASPRTSTRPSGESSALARRSGSCERLGLVPLSAGRGARGLRAERALQHRLPDRDHAVLLLPQDPRRHRLRPADASRRSCTGTAPSHMPPVSPRNYYGYANYDYTKHETHIGTAAHRPSLQPERDACATSRAIAQYERQTEATIPSAARDRHQRPAHRPGHAAREPDASRATTTATARATTTTTPSSTRPT